MKSSRIVFVLLVVSMLALAQSHAQDASRPLRVYGNTTTIELAPVLLVTEVTNGGIPNLFKPGEADVATNAETQALRQSVDHPNLRIIFTVSEGFYRVVARRSAGIAKLEDLRGKRIATVPRTSSAYYLHKVLTSAGLTEADVTIVPMVPLSQIPGAMQRGEIDAVTVWEPEIQKAAELIGPDAIEFQDRSLYRELFNLNTTAENLANPQMRRQIVAFVRSLIKASAQVRREPQEVWPLVAKSSGYDTALISRVWHHEGYPGTMVNDLLDVLVEEEVWVAKERNRTPRTRAELASLIDASVLNEALAQERAETRSATPTQRLERLAFRLEAEEAIRAVKRLHHAYAHYYEAGQWDHIAKLFAKNATRQNIEVSGGGRSGLTEGRLHTALFLSPVITLDRDGNAARGRWHAVFMRGTYGSEASWSGGIYENEYARENGTWKITKEKYFPQYAGAYETGWRNVVSESGAQPALVPYHYTPERASTPIPDGGTRRASIEDVERRLRHLNDEAAIQNLQNAYGFYVDRKMWDDAADLFIDGAKTSIRRSFDQFGPPGLKEGEVNDHLQLHPVITIAADGRTAKARGTQLSMTGVNGVGAQWATSIYENTYVKEDAVWKIASTQVFQRMKTDYAKGWALDAQPAPTRAYKSYPAPFVPKFSFANPGTALSSRPAIEGVFSRKESDDARLTEAERLLAVAEAHDGAENVSNAYGYYIDEFAWHDTSDLFATNGRKELSYIGTYIGRERIRKSMITRYGNGGRRGVFMAIHQKTQPYVSVAGDGQSARIRTRLFQINSQANGDGSYIAGIYENRVVREDGAWKIEAMDLDYTWTTGYEAGWANVKSENARAFAPTTPFPYPPDGPLRGVTYAPFPKIDNMGFHFKNPVSGREPPLLLN